MYPIRFAVLTAALSCLAADAYSDIVTFEDLPLIPNSSEYGAGLSGGFTSGGVTFSNSYDSTWGSWSGFAYSNQVETTTPGYGNQLSAFAGSAQSGNNFAVAYVNGNPAFNPDLAADLSALPTLTLPTGYSAAGVYVTNTTYAALSMIQGDLFAKKFGGPTGDDPDYFLLSVYGLDAFGTPLGTSVNLALADYSSLDNSLDYVLDGWSFLDLSPLEKAASLHFRLTSTDNGEYGMNTPAYFALDDLEIAPAAVPEPSSLLLLGLAGSAGMAVRHARRKRCPKDSDPSSGRA